LKTNPSGPEAASARTQGAIDPDTESD